MELNKHGWSMKEMILLSSILLAFLLVAIFNIMRLYHGLEDKNNKSTSNKKIEVIGHSYEKIEELVLNAGLDYYNEYSSQDGKISTDRLKRRGFLSSKDLRASNESDDCTGYVEFRDGEPFVYISCAKYETEGYEE